VLSEYGIPIDLYTDKAGLFFVNNKKLENQTIEEQLSGKMQSKTQFGTIVDKLGITLIAAHSPQAKGRIERVWETLQDRLITYLKLNGITNMEQFNAVAPQVMDWFNQHFAVEPESSENSFVPLCEKNNLDELLAVKHNRTTDACGCFSFHNITFEIESEKAIVKKKIVFVFSERFGFRTLYNKKYYPVKPLDFLNNSKSLPEVTRMLLFTFYYADGKSTS
jgi:hypothetical protein